MYKLTPLRAAVGLAAGTTLVQLSLVALVFWVPTLLPRDLGMEYMLATRRPLLWLAGISVYVLAPLGAASAAGKLTVDGHEPRRVLLLFGLSSVVCGVGVAAADGTVMRLARPVVTLGRIAAELGGAVLVASVVGVVAGSRFSESGDEFGALGGE